jgi:hypothetical protein
MCSNINNQVQQWLYELKYRISYSMTPYTQERIVYDNVIKELKEEKHICKHIRCQECKIFLRYDDYCECYTEFCTYCSNPCLPVKYMHGKCMECWSEE